MPRTSTTLTVTATLALSVLAFAALTPSIASAKTNRCVVPKLTGHTLPQARKDLKTAHCALGKVKGPRSGKVTGQSAKAKRRFKRGHKVNVTLKAKASTTATTALTEPTLSVGLDPSFTQNQSNPLQVTYGYSASETVDGAPSSLPDGVLEFYSNGLLECSQDVGGSVSSATCEVIYNAYGSDTVNVVYDSGTGSATTGPTQVTISEPPAPPAPPPAATVTTVTATVVGCPDAPWDELDSGGVCYTVTADTETSEGDSVTNGAPELTFAAAETRSTWLISSPALIAIGLDGLIVDDPLISLPVPFAIGAPYTVTASYAATSSYLASTSASLTLSTS